jgi:type VI secretion system secreted protein VgrG
MSSVISLVVKSDGADVSKEIEVISVKTQYRLNEIASANIRINDGDVAKEIFPNADDDKFSPGKKVELLCGYKKGEEKPIFTGVITEAEIGSDYQGILYLELVVNSDTVKLRDFPLSRVLAADKTDDAIIKDLLGETKVSAGDIAVSKIKHKQFVQYGQSAWQCVLQRVFANGYLFVSNAKNSQVIDLAKHEGKEYPIGITRTDIEHFNLKLDVSSQPKSVSAESWNITTQQTNAPKEGSEKSIKSIADADKALERTPWKMATNLPLSEDELTGWATAEVAYRKLDQFKGTITCVVTTENKLSEVEVGDSGLLSGFGKKFDGKWFVTGVEHRIDSNGWQVRLRFGLPLEQIRQQRAAASQTNTALAYANHGLVIGQVAAFEEDPEKLQRIPVTIPGLIGEKMTVWARLISPFASKSEGLFFPPKEKDEVVVGFWQGDSRYPIILGSMHNPINLPPFPYDKKNAEKGVFFAKPAVSLIISEGDKPLTVVAGKGDGEAPYTEVPKDTGGIVFDKEGGVLVTGKTANATVTEKLSLAADKTNLEIDKENIVITAKGAVTVSAPKGTEIK